MSKILAELLPEVRILILNAVTHELESRINVHKNGTILSTEFRQGHLNRVEYLSDEAEALMNEAEEYAQNDPFEVLKIRKAFASYYLERKIFMRKGIDPDFEKHPRLKYIEHEIL